MKITALHVCVLLAAISSAAFLGSGRDNVGIAFGLMALCLGLASAAHAYLEEARNQFEVFVAKNEQSLHASVLEVKQDAARASHAVKVVAEEHVQVAVAAIQEDSRATAATMQEAVKAIQEQALAAQRQMAEAIASVRADASKTAAAVQNTAESISGAVPMVKKALSMNAMLTVGIAVITIVRTMYVRYIASEKKEGRMSQAFVLRGFDGVISVAFIPLLYQFGFDGAMQVWKGLRSIGSLVKSMCSAVTFAGQIIGGDDETAFTGVHLVREVGTGVEELLDRVQTRVEEHKEAGGRTIDGSASSSSSVPYDADVHAAEMMEALRARGFCPAPLPEQEEDAVDQAFGAISSLFASEDTRAPIQPTPTEQAAAPERRELIRIMGVRERCALATLKDFVKSRPWLLPLVLLMIFSALMAYARYTSRPKSRRELRLEAAQLAKEELKERKRVRNGEQEARSNSAASQAGASKPKKRMKPWRDYTVDDEDNVVHTNELGNVEYVAGRRAARHANRDFIAKYGGSGIVSDHVLEAAFEGAEYSAEEFAAVKKELGDATECPECLHLNRCPLKLPADSFAVCDTACGGHHCVHWQGCAPLAGKESAELAGNCCHYASCPKKIVNKPISLVDVIFGRKSGKPCDTACGGQFCTHDHRCSPTEQEAKCVDTNCTGTCGKFHSSKAKAKQALKAAKKAADAASSAEPVCFFCKKAGHTIKDCSTLKEFVCKACGLKGHSSAHCKNVKKEGLVNGPKFFPAQIAAAVGYVECGAMRLNATSCLNGFVTSMHGLDDEDVVFHFGDMTWTEKRSEGKKIGNDTVWFPRRAAQSSIKALHVAQPKMGGKVMLLAYASAEAAKARNFGSNEGVVQCVDEKDGNEKGVYTISTQQGDCGGAVVNTDGRVVGWHNAGRAHDTIFIPVTRNIVIKATGSAPSF